MAESAPGERVALIWRADANRSMQDWIGLTPEQTSGLMLAGGITTLSQAVAARAVLATRALSPRFFYENQRLPDFS